MEKPFQLRLEETKKDIINKINEICNNNSIDYYFLEKILKEIYQETSKLKEDEMKELENIYYQQLLEKDNDIEKKEEINE